MMSAKTEQRVRRWKEQRWILDAVVHTIGVDWDQPRTAYMSGPGGGEAVQDFRMCAARIKKVADIDREYAAAARRREARAKQFEDEGRTVAARESYFIAALLWATARWPIFELNDQLVHLEEKMNECYAKFIQYANRPVERVEIPFDGGTMPGYLHLPHAPAPGEKFPCIQSIGGMDGSKENSVSMYGDKALERGMAVLAIDGPGQGECFARRINVTETSHQDAAEAEFDFLCNHPAIDPDRIILRGSSMGTFFSTQAAARLGDKVKGLAQMYVCHEPGMNTIFNMASPSFKLRFMFMAGYEDEAAFDKFAEKMDPRVYAKDIKVPYLIQAGEDDQLSPIEHSRELIKLVETPRRLVIYEGGIHAIGGVPAAILGENPQTMQSDWLRARIDDQPIDGAEEIYIDATGRQHVTPL